MHQLAPAPRQTSIYDFSAETQAEVQQWQAVLAVLEQSGRKKALSLAREYPHLSGLSIANLYKRLKAYLASGRNPVALIDRRKHRDMQERAATTLPKEFLTFVAGRFLGNQRVCRAAHTRIVIEWKRWLQTGVRPEGWERCGYDRCPAPSANRSGLPEGWSYDNLMERARPTKTELAIARVGTVAAKGLLPYVPVGREGARFMEWIEFDDVKLDRRAIVPPHGPVEVVQFGALDVASGVYLIFGQRPVLPREDKTKEMLTRRDFLFLVAALFEKYGFPTEYTCHLILERGTATLSAAEAHALYDITGGQVVCGYTGMKGEFVVAWDEKATGNSSGKANIESFHNTFHNAGAHLRGQTGKDREHAPALEFGRRREAMDLMKLGALLPAELRGLIPNAYASPEECYLETLEIVDQLNRRETHEMEGFDKIPVWRMKGGGTLWRNMDELAHLPADVLALGEETLKQLIEWSNRVETPHERMEKLKQGVNFARVNEAVWVRFYEDGKAEAVVSERLWVELKRDGVTMVFGPDEPSAALPAKTEVLAYFAQHDPDRAHITVNGRYVGSWPRVRGAGRGDPDAKRAGIARSNRYLRAAVAGVRGKSGEALLQQTYRSQQINALSAAAVPVLARAAEARLQEISTPGAEGLQAMTRAVQAVPARSVQPVLATEPSEPNDCTAELLARAANPLPVSDDWE